MPTNNDSDTTSTNGDSHIDLREIEDSVIQQEDDALNSVVRYHFNEKQIPSLKLELLKQSGLFLISGLGVLFYYQPTKTYAQSICEDPAYKNIPCSFFISNHVTGTLLVAGGILMVATNAFMDQQNASDIPIQLKKYLRALQTRKQKVVENVLTWVGSFIASAPFIIITVVNPIPGLPKFLIISQACLVGMTNTALHLLPFKLAFKEKFYRLPSLPFEFIFQKVSNSFLSKEEKQAQKLQAEIDKNLQMLKQILIDRFNLAKRLISIKGFKFTGCAYRNEVINPIRDIRELNDPPIEQLNQFFLLLNEMSPRQFISLPGSRNNFLRKLAYFIGALWVIFACSGFWGGTFNEMVELTGGLMFGALASFLSIYCLCVLLAFFGGNALQNTSDYLTIWEEDTIKIALPFKLYPKTSASLLLISTYLSIFSYAAGAQLINDNFNDKLDFLRPYLLEIAKTGLIFLGFNAMVDLLISGLSKFGQYGGDEDTKTILQLAEALNQMGNSMQLMDSSLLLQSLAQKSEEQLKIFFNINNENDQQNLSKILIQLADNLKEKLLFNYKSKVIDVTEHDDQFVELLVELKSDQFHTLDKIEALLVYLTNKDSPLSLEEGEDYKNVCKIIDTLDSANLMGVYIFDASINNDEGYAGPSTETTPLLSSNARSLGGSICSYFFHPSRPPPQFYSTEDRTSYPMLT